MSLKEKRKIEKVKEEIENKKTSSKTKTDKTENNTLYG